MPLLSCFKGRSVSSAYEPQQRPVQHATVAQDDAHAKVVLSKPSKRSLIEDYQDEQAVPVAESNPLARDKYVELVHLLATLEGGWWSALSEACQATCEYLDAVHACIYVLSPSEMWATVAACAGVGEATVAGRAFSCDPRFNASAASAIHRVVKELGSERAIVYRSLPIASSSTDSSGEAPMVGPLRSAMRRAGTGPSTSGGTSAAASTGGATSSDDLPGDWQLLYEDHGCRQFVAVALGNASGELVGVLSLAAKGPMRPAGWTPDLLHSVICLLANNIRRAQAVLASPALSQLHSAATFSDMVQAAAEAAADAAAAVAFTRGTSRVAVIHAAIGAAAIFQQQQQQQHQAEGDALASVPLLRARRSSCEFVLMPTALRKSITTITFPRMSVDGVGVGDRATALPAEGLKRDSWGANRQMSTAQANGSFTLAFPRGVPCKGHTLSLDKTLLGETLCKQVAGLCIDDCQTHTVSTKAYPRDLILSRGAVMPMSLALATASAEGKPLMALYVTFATTLPKPLLQTVVQELQQLLQAILPTVCAKLSGVLRPEYEYLARQLEGAVSRRNHPEKGAATADNPDGTRDTRASDCSVTMDLAEGAEANRVPGDPPAMLSFVLGDEPLVPPEATAAAAGPAGVTERPSPSCAPSTPTYEQHATAQQTAAAAALAGGTGGLNGRPMVRSLPPEFAYGTGGGGGAGAAVADRLRQLLRPPSPPSPRSPLGVGSAVGPREWQEASLVGELDLGLAATRRSGCLQEEPPQGSGAGAWPQHQPAGGGGAGGQQRSRLRLDTTGRPLSACEPGVPGTRRLLNSLADMRSVSFHLEKAQAPRGASKLAPIIASVHDRLKAAQAVQMAVSRSESRKADLRSVKLLQEIGQGGYGTVYRGTYHGAEVAVKVIKQSRLAGVHSSSNALASCSAGLGLHKQHLHDAIELVASVSMSHINIVQVPAYFMDVRLEVPEDLSALDSVDQPFQPTESRPFRLMHSPSLLESPAPGQEGHALGEGAMALVLEYCDCGSLCDAIMSRKFIEKVTPRKDTSGTAGKTYLAINMRSVYTTLLEIALALRHMHSLALVHCDLKPQNVLLKSSPRDPRGFTAKLSDFGLAKMMAHDDHGQLVIDEAVASGTITHVAPEVLLGQSSLGAAVDIYAFGILMFQTLCGMKVYDKSMSPSGIANAVAHNGMRPQMPSWAPQNFKALAKRCWSHDPAERPTADELVRQLEGALEAKKCTGGRPQPEVQSPPRQQAPSPPQQAQQQQQKQEQGMARRSPPATAR